MNKVIKEVLSFIKKETVLAIAFILAVISSFFVAPSLDYLDYIDFRVLGILLSLMIIMVAFQQIGIFDKIGTALLKQTTTVRQLCGVLILLCFFSSMLITNDVALITFVPFALFTLKKANREDKMIFVIVLQTVAANLGSMLTPTGNPQNLYLYSISEMSFSEFMFFMLPYTAISLAIIIITLFFCKDEKIDTTLLTSEKSVFKFDKKIKLQTTIYTLLFVLGILTVCHLIPYYILLAVVVVAVLLLDRRVLLKVDYCLIFTFICFFIFIGNIGNIESVKTTLDQAVKGNEVLIGIISSQAISNVPATLMLSGFTTEYKQLLLGVNIGGLGTLIASMASLISYKMYAQNYNTTKGKYMFWFTVYNVGFLVLLFSFSVLID
ncbi:MAG: SLC13 family permease [Acutalibacteraceae bacterium]|nr:SLC13 family permease [Acutalibacteraceae bacterium]